MTTYNFPRITVKRTLSGRCSLCGRPMRRSRTFEMTVNPFNRNPDGTVRTAAEVRAAVNAEALAWAPNLTHQSCAGEPEDGHLVTAYDECAYEWTDGWASADDPHRCHLRDDHDGKCVCDCAAETWRAAS